MAREEREREKWRMEEEAVREMFSQESREVERLKREWERELVGIDEN